MNNKHDLVLKENLKIEIMAIGSELLTAHFQDTNSLYLTERLNDIGLDVTYKTIIGDDWDNLVLGIKQTLSRADLIITIGGLGPTRDDITREAFASVLQRKLVFKKEVLREIEMRFNRRGVNMPSVNKKQSYIIEGADILENRNGTAPGQWFENGSKIIILLPGPPHELKPMFESSIWPRLQKLRASFTARTVLKITGLPESKIETLISDLYPQESDIKITTLAYPGQIEIHISSQSKKSQHKAKGPIHELKSSILERLQKNVFSTSGEELEEVLGNLLRRNRKTLGVAESCTGGFLSHRLTNISGSSDYFLQGIVAYSNEAKINNLGVSTNLIENYGAVSPQVAESMALGIRAKSKADFGLSITGIAGPTGGTEEKPIGLVYTALATEEGTKVSKNLFLGNREVIKFQSSQKAMDMLRRHLINTFKTKEE